jgi:hypothetical protein
MIAYIVGRGPSLLSLTSEDFGPGPVIALNAAIHYVRTLALPNPIWWMWKDGCLAHGQFDNDPHPHECTLPHPEPGEHFVTSWAEGRYCGLDFPDRHVIDIEREYLLPWYSLSAPVAVELARELGVTELVILGHDAYTTGGQNTRRWMPDGSFEDDPHAGYYLAGHQAQERAALHGIPIRWDAGVPA